MPRVEKCAKCGGAVIQRAMIVDESRKGETNLKVRVDADPTAMVFKKATRSDVHAYICSSCGFTELYADNPEELYRAFQAARSKSADLDLK